MIKISSVGLTPGCSRDRYSRNPDYIARSILTRLRYHWPTYTYTLSPEISDERKVNVREA